MKNPDYIEGYSAYYRKVSYSETQSLAWRAGWMAAAEDESIDRSENARFH